MNYKKPFSMTEFTIPFIWLIFLIIDCVPTFLFLVRIGPHFYTEVLGKRYEVDIKNEEQSETKVLVRLGRF